MTFALVHASYSLRQAVKLTFFAPCSLSLHVVKVKALAFKCYSPWSSKWTQSQEDFTKNIGQETKTVCLREKDRRGGVRMSFFLVRTVFTTLRAEVLSRAWLSCPVVSLFTPRENQLCDRQATRTTPLTLKAMRERNLCL